MKKGYLSFLMILIISLTGCSQNITPTITDNSSVRTSSEPPSSNEVSANEVSAPSSDETSSDTASSERETSVSSKETSSKSTSSNPVSKPSSSKATSSNPPVSSKEESKPSSSAAEPETPILPADDAQFSTATVEQILFKLVNDERVTLNLSKLAWNEKLYQSAKIRSDEMAAQNSGLDISHTRPNGDAWNSTLKEVNYSEYYAYANENIAAVKNGIATEVFVNNTKLANMIFDGWKNSPPHYEAIIRPETIEIGIAISRNETDVYAAQHFGQIEK